MEPSDPRATPEGDDAGDDPTPLDPELAVALREAIAEAEGPVPDGVLRAAKGAWAWRDVDAELAELLEEDTLAVRSGEVAAATGPVAFSVPGVVIDVERDGDAVLGQVGDEDGAPLEAAVVVEVAGTDGSRHAIAAELDAAGGFRVVVPPGRSRVAVTLAGRRIVTPWLAA